MNRETCNLKLSYSCEGDQYYLSTVLDDYSRYIIHWEICDSMKAEDVKRTVNKAIEKAKLKSKAKPKLLSDNGSCYISNEVKTYLRV